MNTPNQPGAAGPVSKADKSRASAGAFISLGGMALLLVNLFFGWIPLLPVVNWLLIAALIILFLLALGWNRFGKWYGALIDNRNRVSLSRLQIILWSILALSAYLAVALMRSVPGATAAEVAQCVAAQVKQIAGVEDVVKWRQDNPQLAAEADRKAAEACKPVPLQITFPEGLLLALGISSASFAGSSLVTSAKRNKTNVSLAVELQKRLEAAQKDVDDKKDAMRLLSGKLGAALRDKAKAQAALDSAPDDNARKNAQADLAKASEGIRALEEQLAKLQVDSDAAEQVLKDLKAKNEVVLNEKQGLLKVNDNPDQASLSDMFQGDEIGNYQQIDLGKVQMFFFTIVIVLGYAVALAGMLQDATTLYQPLGMALPEFSSSTNVLLGISHAGYLGVKSIDQTSTSLQV